MATSVGEWSYSIVNSALVWTTKGQKMTLAHPRDRQSALPQPPRCPIADATWADDLGVWQALITAGGAGNFAAAVRFVTDHGFSALTNDVSGDATAFITWLRANISAQQRSAFVGAGWWS
jgi:hypothetical protein